MTERTPTTDHADTNTTVEMPHSTSELRQADKRRLPFRVLIISTILAVLALGLVFAYFAQIN